MKALLVLSIILGGVLITKNSYADATPSRVSAGSDNLQVVPTKVETNVEPVIEPKSHQENASAKLPCQQKTDQAAKTGNTLNASLGSGKKLRAQ